MPYDRIVLVLKNYLGDTVMAAPLLDALLGAKKDVTIASSQVVDDLLTSPNRKFGFLPISLGSPSDTFATSAALKQGRFDAALVVNRSFRSALAVRLAGIKTRVGHSTEGRGFLLTHSSPYDMNRNETECYLDLARRVGVDERWQRPSLWVSDKERAEGAAMMRGATIVLQPGARHAWKTVPKHVWVKTIQEIQDLGHKVVLIGGPDEVEVGNSLVRIADVTAVDLVGKTSLRQTLGILASARLAMGGDTGVMHLAAGVNCPTLVAFGGVKPVDKWAHDYTPHRHVQIQDLMRLDPDSLTVPLREMLLGQ